MSNQNNITELRGILFETLRGLKDKSIDIERAKAISETAQVIINTAKVEVAHARHTGQKSTSFLEEKTEVPRLPGNEPTSYVHRMGGDKKQLKGV